MEKKNLFIGMDMCNNKDVDSSILSICMIVDDKTFYMENNSIDLGQVNPMELEEKINKMLFINNEEPHMCYTSGEKGITYIKDDMEMITEHIQNILMQYFRDHEVRLIGDLNAYQFVAFSKILKNTKLLKHINIDDYVSIVEVNKVLNMIKLNDFNLKEVSDRVADNLIVSTHINQNIFSMFKQYLNL